MSKITVCAKCGKKYHLTPVYASRGGTDSYGYDDEYIAEYEDKGCSYYNKNK